MTTATVQSKVKDIHINTDLLIAEVKKRQFIYQKSDPDYYNHNLRNEAFLEISDVLKCDPKHAYFKENITGKIIIMSLYIIKILLSMLWSKLASFLFSLF